MNNKKCKEKPFYQGDMEKSLSPCAPCRGRK